MERLHKADGHINSAQRKLGYREVERGIWSAVQAKARFAEAWLWLNGAGIELPPLERYLARNVVRERLAAFQRAPKSDLMATAWKEAEEAEQAVREVEFPSFTDHLTVADRALLEESLSRRYRFIDALRQIRHVVEEAVAKRFLKLRRGDWVRLENGDIGRIQRLNGLTIRIFVPGSYPRSPGPYPRIEDHALGYGLVMIERVECPMGRKARGEGPPSAVVLPEVVAERLRKANRHINTVFHKRRNKNDDWIRAGEQAKARLAEAWLWLHDGGREHPPLERRLARDVVRRRLEAFQRAPKSDLMASAWQEVETIERAGRGMAPTLFPDKTGSEDRQVTEKNQAGKDDYVDALRQVQRIVEDVVAERFLDLQPGDRVRPVGGAVAVVKELAGLTVRVIALTPFREIRDYPLLSVRIERVEPPVFDAPEEGWIERAWRLARGSLFRPDDYPAPAGESYPREICSAIEVRMGCEERYLESWYVSLGEHTVEIPFSEDSQHQLPALIEWLQAISRGYLPVAIELDDEGPMTTMIAHASDSAGLFVLMIEPLDEETGAVAALVDRDSFLDAFRSWLEIFLREYFSDPDDYQIKSIIDVEDMLDHPFMIRK